MNKKGIALLLFCLLISGLLQKVYCQIDSDRSKITFGVSHVTGMVEGTITGMQGTVIFDENNLPGSRMEATVEAKTVDTGNKARDSDLRKGKFFDVDQYQQVKFSSKEITKTATGFQVTGDLTIKDRTRQVTIPFEREVKGGEEIFSGNFTLDRRDYNLGKGAFPPIGKEVKVSILAVVRK